MRIFFYLFILLFLNITITLSAGELKINVTNIKINIGSIHYALYDDPSFFPDEKGKIDGGNKRIDEVVANGILIKELNESYYAVAIYHDENSNKKFDTFLSLPREQYGFSNNAPVFLGPPNFEDAAVFVEQNKTTEIEIELR